MASEREPLDEKDEIILSVLSRYPDGLGVNELHRKVKDHISKPTLSKRLEKLERMGLIKIERGRHGQKHRIKHVEASRYLLNALKTLEKYKNTYINCVKELDKLTILNEETRIKLFRELFGTFLEAMLGLILILPKDAEKAKEYIAVKALLTLRDALRETFPTGYERLESIMLKMFKNSSKKFFEVCESILKLAKKYGVT